MIKAEISYKAILVALGIVFVAWALVKLWPIVILLVFSLIFMAALLPFVEWMQRKGVPKGLAIIFVLVIILAAIASIFAIVIPAVLDEFEDVRNKLPEHALNLQNLLANFGIDVDLETEARQIDWTELLSGDTALSVGQQVAFGIFTGVTVIMVTLYLLSDAQRISRFIYQLTPADKEKDVQRLLTSLRSAVGGYVRGQLILSVSISTFTLIVLLALDVPGAAAYAILAGFFDIIPMVGALLAVGMPVLAAFDESPTTGFIALGLLLAYQQFEDRFYSPKVYGRTLNLPSLVVLLAVLCGAKLMGILGVLLAVPTAAALKAVFEYMIEKRGGLPNKKAEILAPDEIGKPEKPPGA